MRFAISLHLWIFIINKSKFLRNIILNALKKEIFNDRKFPKFKFILSFFHFINTPLSFALLQRKHTILQALIY